MIHRLTDFVKASARNAVNQAEAQVNEAQRRRVVSDFEASLLQLREDDRKRRADAAAADAAAAAAAPQNAPRVHADFSTPSPLPYKITGKSYQYMEFLDLCYYEDKLFVRCDLHDDGCQLIKAVDKEGLPIKSNVLSHFKTHHKHDGMLDKFTKAGENEEAHAELINAAAQSRDKHGNKCTTHGPQQGQRSLPSMFGARRERPSEAVVRATLFFVSTRLPWRAANDFLFRDFLSSTTTMKVSSLHEKALRTIGLDAVYKGAMHMQLAELRAAPGVSVAFDGWTMAGKRRAVIGVIFTFLDSDFQQRAVLVGAPVVDTSHTASNVAIIIAKIVQQYTLPHQQLYCTMTDTASNMLKAGQHLVDRVNELASESPTLLLDTIDGSGNVDDIDDDVASLQNIDDSDDDDDDADADAELNWRHESARVGKCFGHILGLMAVDALKDVPELKVMVDQIDRIVAAMSMSEQRKSMLQNVLTVLKHVPKPLIRRPPTRWHILGPFLERYAHCHPAVVVMFARGLFKKVALKGEVITCPSDDMPARCRAVAILFELLDQAGRTLEGTTYCTMAFVPTIAREVLSSLSSEAEDRGLPEVFRKVRLALFQSAERRLLPLLKPSSPAIVGALMHPLTGGYLLNVISYPEHAQTVAEEDRSVGKPAIDEVVGICADWYAHISEAALDAAAPVVRTPIAPPRADANDSASKLRKILEDTDAHDYARHGDDAVAGAAAAAAVAERERERELQARKVAFNALRVEGVANVKKLLIEFASEAHLRSYSAPPAYLRTLQDIALMGGRDQRVGAFVAANKVRDAQTALKDFYSGSTLNGLQLKGTDAVARLRLLARCLLGTTAMSAGVESVFSLAGLIDSELRVRMTAERFEKLLVASYAVQRLKAEVRAQETEKQKAEVVKKFIELCVK